MPESKSRAWAVRLTDGTVFEFILTAVVPLADGIIALKRGSTVVAYVPASSIAIISQGAAYSEALRGGDEYRSARRDKSDST